MPTVDFLPFATGGGANVESQASYVADTDRGPGFSAGTAISQKCNKVWRQGTFFSAVIANFISGVLGIDVLDDGNVGGKVSDFAAAIAAIPSSLASFGTVSGATFTAVAADKGRTIMMTGTGAGSFNFALPDPATLTNTWSIRLLLRSADGDYVTMVPGGAATIDDLATRVAGVGTDVTIYFDGTDFRSAGTYRFVTGYIGLPTNGEATIAHGFGAVPTRVFGRIKNVSTEFGYGVGDIIELSSAGPDNVQGMVNSVHDAGNTISRVMVGNRMSVLSKTTHINVGSITAAKWNLQGVAELSL